jgi:N-acyl-phosphatidylethanolamine-hydrolysing phospholipase D
VPIRRFTNPHIKNSRRTLKDLILWKLGYYDDAAGHPQIPSTFTYPKYRKTADQTAPTVTWINHSSFLVQIKGISLLTDPIYSNRCSPVPLIGPKRRHPPGIPFNALPQIDYVVISHDHYDHLDKKTVLALHRRNPEIVWLVPCGVKQHLQRWGISNVEELDWWNGKKIECSELTIQFTAVPSQHFSGRTAKKINTTLWAGWVIEFFISNLLFKRLYFAGDTGYNPFDFKKIGKQFGQMDLSLIPIGCYSPQAFMQPVHIAPRESVRIHREVHSQLSIGMHWKTFRLSDEPMDQPPYDLFLQLKEEGIDPASFLVVEPGDGINW